MASSSRSGSGVSRNASLSRLTTTHQPNVCRILPVNGQQIGNTNVDLILIPGVGTPGVELWSIRFPPWTDIISTALSRPRILTFNYNIPLDDRFSWQTLFIEASCLLESLHEICMESETNDRPLIFICHSLGGIILKQALSVANQQSRKYVGVLNLISGIMFLGTPHRLDDEKQLGEKLLLLLKSLPNDISKQTLSRLEGDALILANAADRFKDVNLRVDIASVGEKKKSKVRHGRFGRKGVVVVGPDLARTLAPVEVLFLVQQDHENLWRLDNSDGTPDTELVQWLQHVVGNATTVIQNRLAAYKSRTPPMVSPSTTSSDDSIDLVVAAEHALQSAQGDSSGADADHGSSTFGFEIVPILDELTIVRRQAKLPCFMMDTFVRNPKFFGRDDVMKRLDEVLLPNNDATVSSEGGVLKHIALCGMGGLGKTEIAIEYAYSRREKFDAIFWIRADEEENLELDFSRIATSLELEDPSDPNNQQVNRELVKGWLANPKKLLEQTSDTVGLSEATWLVILDNADNADILDNLKPIFGSGSLLITSRDPLTKMAFSFNPVGIDLEPLSEEEAVQFLKQLVPREEEEGVHEIVNTLGCLPLAITQMASVIRKQFLPYSDFLKQYQDEAGRDELHSLQLDKNPRATARGTIASIFAIERLSVQARTLLELSSFLNPDSIPERIFVDNSSITFPNFPQKIAAWNAARGELLQASLVKRNNEKRELWMHRILQDSVRAKLDGEKAINSFMCTVNLVSNAWPRVTIDKRHTTDRWQECEKLFPHVLALKNYYEKRFEDGSIEPMLELASLLHEAGWWQHERGNSHHIRPFLNLSQNICEAMNSPQTRDLLSDVHYALEAVATETNDPEGCLHHTGLLLDLRIKAVADDEPPGIRLAVAHNERGIAWMMNGAYDKAAAEFKEGISVYKSLPSFWYQMISLPLANLGLSYWLAGDYEAASEVLLESLHGREKHLGYMDKDSFRTGRLLHGLGNVRFSQGLIEESENYHRRALAQYQSTIGNNHHRTADVCHRVAQHCLRHRELEAAM
ncbi:hypothetical protein ONS95_006270 [Cadophora gregata]|uniref:uncharacterized protein n=1 Tax=Cadophora gregata TaxID=51156 RepID=UPI0026DDBCD8|nr:uncharacterized protein ONS95_006270 [Cadophora gregata]KAK0102667.1 hypothetical protein ONS95_006270 [Cadophora gregata]KAK0104324.1 hypothetical protein ONS96_005409 [Cadophora gregata f. sp. sojae]